MAQGYSSDGHTVADHLLLKKKSWPKDIHRTATLLKIIFYLKIWPKDIHRTATLLQIIYYLKNGPRIFIGRPRYCRSSITNKKKYGLRIIVERPRFCRLCIFKRFGLTEYHRTAALLQIVCV